MRFTIAEAADYPRGDLYERRTVEETLLFLDTLCRGPYVLSGSRSRETRHYLEQPIRRHGLI